MRFLLFFVAIFTLCAAEPPKGTVERIKVHGKLLEGNLAGDSADRDVSVYLPPSYASEPARRYPVVYLLHGFTDSDELWFGFKKHWISVPPIFDKAVAAGLSKEMIVVMPNALTLFGGSMYSTSAVTGDWEMYVTRELVAYIDGHYRTLASAESRGLAGHSMGGYGALRIGMKHPSVFSSVYLLSPCCLAADVAPKSAAMMAAAEKVSSREQIAAAGFMTKAMLASAAAWSPNPKAPPFFLDLPTKNGEFQPAVAARWAASSPLWMIDQYVPNFRRLRALAFDAGDRDGTITETTAQLHRVLEGYGLTHQYEGYEGDHVNRIAERIEKKVLPFFSAKLSFAKPNISGRWRIDTSRSETQIFPLPEGIWRVTQTEKTLTVGPEGQPPASTPYDMTGAPTQSVTAEATMTSVVSWDGETLVIDSKGISRGQALAVHDRLTGAADGRTMRLERRFTLPHTAARQVVTLERIPE